jgi:hypothetical protein
VQARLLATYDERATQLRAAMDGLRVSDDELRAEPMEIAQRRALQAEKDALLALRNRGALTGGVYRSLAAGVDARLLHLEESDEPIAATAHYPETNAGETLSPVPLREDEAG